jgi:hypothetical protein
MDPYSVASTLMKWGFVGLTGGLGAYIGAYLKAKGESWLRARISMNSSDRPIS